MAFAWSGLFVACLCSLKRSRSVRLVSPIYLVNTFFTPFTLDHICQVSWVTSNVMFNLSCFSCFGENV